MTRPGKMESNRGVPLSRADTLPLGQRVGATVQVVEQEPLSWRPTTVKWRQFSQSNRHSTIGTRQTESHEASPSSANDEMRCDCTFTYDGNASRYSVCRVPMVEWRLDCQNCRYFTVVGLHDTGPWWWCCHCLSQTTCTVVGHSGENFH